jgi:outer membrane protein TolC
LGQSFEQLFNYQYKGYSLGFNFTMPLNNKGPAANHDKAVTDRQTSEANMAAIAQQILLDVRNALQQVELNRARIDTAQTALDLEQQRLDAEKTKFELGTSTLRFVLDEQNNLAVAQTTLLQTRVNFAKALIDLDNAMGLTLQRSNVELEKALNTSNLSQYKPASLSTSPGTNQK